MATIIHRLNNEALADVSVQWALLSNSGQVCRVGVRCPAGKLVLLQGRYRQAIQAAVGRAIARKTVPRLEFVIDGDEAERIERLVKER